MVTNDKAVSNKKPHKLQFKLAIVIAFTIGSMAGYGSAVYHQIQTVDNLSDSQIQIRFSPRGGCIKFINQAIERAQQQILVQAYAFTSAAIAKTLIDAHKRGVAVKILVDRSQLTGKGSQVKRIYDSGIPIAIDVVPGIAHNKVMIIDDMYVFTGSFNWSNAAEYRNAENLVLFSNKEVNRIYRENWKRRAATAMAINLDKQMP